MDDIASRAGKLAGLLFLAAGMSGCMTGTTARQTSQVRTPVAPAVNWSQVAKIQAVNSNSGSNPQYGGLQSVTLVADKTNTGLKNSGLANSGWTESPAMQVAADVRPDPETPGTLTLEIPEIPLDSKPDLNGEPERLQSALAQAPIEQTPLAQAPVASTQESDDKSEADEMSQEPVVADKSIAAVDNEPAAAIPELPSLEGVPTETEEVPVLAHVMPLIPTDTAASSAETEEATGEEPPGRAYICNNEDPVVIYQELAVPVPADRWPGYSKSAGSSKSAGGPPRMRTAARRRISGNDSSTRGIVRSVDHVQGTAQVVFAGMTQVEPGTLIAVQHQMLFGRLASTEYLEVVASEPGTATLRAIGESRISKAASGDPAIVMTK